MAIKKTKIVCTIGPASADPKILKSLMQAGMDVARLNCSHGTNEEKAQNIKDIKKISQELGKNIAIFADLSGPKIRLGKFEGVVNIKAGQKVTLSLNPVDDELPMEFDLSPFVKKGQRIYLNDGLVSLKVLDIKNKQIKTEAQNSGWVSSRKGVNVPDTILKGATFTDKDREDAIASLKNNVDYLALSFVQSVDGLKEARELIKKYNPRTKIIVKVEKNEAVENMEEIVAATDAIMVARGDLGIEMPASEVPIIQQKLIKLCRQANKPVIVATQMLESMIENPRATRAEISDVASAVLDQVDAVMLSAETASGKYPVEAVTVMSDTIKAVEAHPDYKHYFKINWDNLPKDQISPSAIASSAASLGYRIGAKMIAVTTSTGKIAKLISSFRPDSSILAITDNEDTKTQLGLVWGTDPIIIKPTKDYDSYVEKIVNHIKDNKLANKGDHIVVVTGSTVGITGATDQIKVVTL